MTQATNFPPAMLNGRQIAAGVIDIYFWCHKNFQERLTTTGVVTSGKFVSGVNDTCGHFAAGVVDTGGVPIVAKILANFRQNSK